MVREGETWHMFFEVYNTATERGEIGWATSSDGLDWAYRQVVLREPFHLSYPFTFAWNNTYYMIPETLGRNAVRLYRADPFPSGWSYTATLIDGLAGVDATPFFRDGLWWMLVGARPGPNDTLRLYCAEELEGPWKEHPASPVVQGDPRGARPAGRVAEWGSRLLRFGQDCKPTYGSGVRAFEITRLTPTAYEEENVGEHPVLQARGAGWNGLGMHHLDVHELAPGRWVACVDGFARAHRGEGRL
jgi:hypothetical protein